MKDKHIQEKYKQLIYKFLYGNLPASEELRLKEWIDAEPENMELYKFYRNTWLVNPKANHNFNTSETWQAMEKTINSSSAIKKPKRNVLVSGNGLQYLLKIAASIFFLLASWFLFSIHFNLQKEQYTIIKAPLGSKTQIILPDSSEVWLNAGSTLSYPNRFNRKERNVTLTGEANFSVTTNKYRPFVVSANQIKVKAYGTSFNVKAYPNDEVISALLTEGSITVDADLGDSTVSYTLIPNQNIAIEVKPYIDPESIKIEDVNTDLTEAIVSWKEDHWKIQGESLNTLAILLERKYNIKIHIISDELNKYRFSGAITNETFEQVMQYLRYTTPLKYQIGKGEVWWDIDPELAKNYNGILKKNSINAP